MTHLRRTGPALTDARASRPDPDAPLRTREEAAEAVAKLLAECPDLARAYAAERPSGYCRHGREPRHCGCCARST